MVEITVTKTIQSTPNEVFALLMDLNTYSNWWHLPVQAVCTEMVRFKPIPLVSIVLQKDIYIENKAIQFSYIKGPFRGLGTWDLDPVGEDQTKVSYLIQLEATNFLYGGIARSAAFEARHRKDIFALIRGIQGYLDN